MWPHCGLVAHGYCPHDRAMAGRVRIEELVGARVRALRTEQSMTQAQLAEGAGIATHTLSRIERGAQPPTLATLGRLAEALDVHPASLLAAEGAVDTKGATSAFVRSLPSDPAELRRRLKKALRVLADGKPS